MTQVGDSSHQEILIFLSAPPKRREFLSEAGIALPPPRPAEKLSFPWVFPDPERVLAPSVHTDFSPFCASLSNMSPVLDPIISEFETEEQAVSYDGWFRAKVQEAIDCKKPRIPHDQVMAEMDAIISQAEVRHIAHQA